MTDPNQQQTQQPQQPREPDNLDVLASNLLGIQSSLTVLGTLVYGALTCVRQLQQARGQTPAALGSQPAAGAPPVGPMSRAQVEAGMRVADGRVELVAPPQSRATFGKRRDERTIIDERTTAPQPAHDVPNESPDAPPAAPSPAPEGTP